MIATDHQYRVTNEKLDKFRSALKAAKIGQGLPEPFRSVRTRAIKEQIASLERELREYDELRSGKIAEISVDGLAELPTALVKARIARGLNQSALAELIGVKPQQVQRWEADGYSRVGFDRLKRIAGELRVRIPQKLSLHGDPPLAPSDVRRMMAAAGLPREVFDRAILPSTTAEAEDDNFVLADEIDCRMQALFGLGALAFRGGADFAKAALRFKLPGSADQQRTRAYAAYVNGVCRIVAKCLPHVTRPLPKDWRKVRSLLFPKGELSLSAALDICWTSGIAVVAMDDPVAFHGACWRRDDRTVIVLKQSFPDQYRWLFDLIHELFHIVAAPEGDFTVLEANETSSERQTSQEERRASRFAAEVLTNGRARELTDRIVDRAGHFTQRLKFATIEIAGETGLPTGLLANLLAQRLTDDPSNESWWATAAALQDKDDRPWKVVRDAFLRNANIDVLDRVERDIILQLMETQNERPVR